MVHSSVHQIRLANMNKKPKKDYVFLSYAGQDVKKIFEMIIPSIISAQALFRGAQKVPKSGTKPYPSVPIGSDRLETKRSRKHP